MSFFKKIKEKFSRLFEDKGVFIVGYKASQGEKPRVTFKELRDWYLKDPSVMAAVDYIAEQAVGAGFYTTSESIRAKKLVDEFCYEVNLDGLLMQIAKECIYAGNSFVEKIFDKQGKLIGLKILPLTSIERIVRDEYGHVKKIIQKVNGKTVEFNPNEIIHFKYNCVDGSAYGVGVIQPLAEEIAIDDRHVRPSLLKVKATIESIIPKIFYKYAAPKRIWKFLGLSESTLNEYQSLIQNAPEDSDLITNQDVQVSEISVDPRARFESFINYIESQLITGLQTPVVKLYTAPGFTEASAKVAKEVSERKIEFLRRFLKRVVEREIFKPIVDQAGLTWENSQVKLNWGMEEKPKLEFQDIMKAFELGAISSDEVRNMLAKLGFELIEKEKA